MKEGILFSLIVVVMILLSGNSFLYAWSGEPPFGSISRETILRRATEMLELSWSPLKLITNDGEPYSPYMGYRAEAYCWGGSQNFSEFYNSCQHYTRRNYLLWKRLFRVCQYKLEIAKKI